jgi:hypothetical protein
VLPGGSASWWDRGQHRRPIERNTCDPVLCWWRGGFCEQVGGGARMDGQRMLESLLGDGHVYRESSSSQCIHHPNGHVSTGGGGMCQRGGGWGGMCSTGGRGMRQQRRYVGAACLYQAPKPVVACDVYRGGVQRAPMGGGGRQAGVTRLGRVGGWANGDGRNRQTRAAKHVSTQQAV